MQKLLVDGDSQLIVRQVNDIYEVRKPDFEQYHMAAQILMKKFKNIQILHVPRSKNSCADALAKLAAALVLPDGKPTQVNIKETWLLQDVLELVPQESEV